MKPFLAFFASLLIAVTALGQNGPVQNHSFLGATAARTSGLNSTNYLDGVIPSATITVYLTGTQTLATIFTNSGGTPLANPFTSNALTSVNPGGWIFWAATNQGYDVVMSGGISPNTYPQPVTLVDQFPGAPGGGGPPASGCVTTGAAGFIQLNNGTGGCANADADYSITNGGSFTFGDANSGAGADAGFFVNAGAEFIELQGSTGGMRLAETGDGGINMVDAGGGINIDETSGGTSIQDGEATGGVNNGGGFSIAEFSSDGGLTLTDSVVTGGGTATGGINIAEAGTGGLDLISQLTPVSLASPTGNTLILTNTSVGTAPIYGSTTFTQSTFVGGDNFMVALPRTSGILGVLEGSITPDNCLASDPTGHWIVDAGVTCGGTSPLTTKGDIYVFSSVATRLPVGTNGQVLSANSAQTTGLQWISAFTNPMTTLGDTVYGGAAGAVTRLTGSISASTLCLTQTGTGSVSAAPVWGSCAGSATTALSSITAASTSNTAGSGNNPIVWNWAQTSNTQTAFTFGETSAATGTGDQELAVTTVAGSTAVPLTITDSLNSAQTIAALQILPTWNTSGVVDAALLVNVTNTASGAASKLFDLKVGGTSEMAVDDAGIITNATWAGVAIANAHLANPSTTVNGQTCTLGSTCTVASTKTAITHEWLNSFTSTTGLFTATQPAFTDISGQATNAQLATLGANQVLGALTATTPTGLAIPSCSGAANALTWTSGTGFGCNTITSGGTAPTIQTNGVNNTTQTVLNFVNPAAFNGLSFTFSNPSGGVETFGATGTLTNAGLSNSTITLGSTSVALGATITSAAGFNAATATNLASYPTLCTGATFSKGLSSGSNNCSTPAGGGNVSTSGTTTTGFYPVLNGSTTITNGHLDDGVTTPSTVTSSEAFAAPSMKVGSGSGTTIVSGSGVPTGCGSTYANGSLYLNLTGTAGVTFGTGSLLYSCNGGTTTWNNII